MRRQEVCSRPEPSVAPVGQLKVRVLGSASAAVLCATLAMVGCGSDTRDPASGPDYFQLDSAGVRVSVSTAEVAHAALGWTVEPEPDLVLGGGASAADNFFNIQGLRGDSAGGVLVVDGGSEELRFFGSDGRLLRRAGGAGQGPEEFGDPVLVPVMGSDSLLVFDRDLMRAQVLAPEGEFARLMHFREGRPYGGRAPLGTVAFRYMLFNTSGTVGGGEAPRPETGMLQLRQSFMWYDAATAERLTFDSVVIDTRYYAREEGRRLDWVVPFTVRSSATASTGGAFLTHGRRAEIREYGVDGQLQQIYRIRGGARPTTRERIDSFIDLELDRRPERYGSLPRDTWYDVYDDINIPDSLPAFQDIRVDELGWLWAERYQLDSSRPRTWVVFDLGGRARGTVRTPAGLDVQWIGPDAILGIWRNELDVEFVHRHRLVRDAARRDSSTEGS